jgi:ATP synthase mitochondrial F1 complex assembly factor 1
LDEILNLDRIAKESPETIRELWKLYHENRNNLYGYLSMDMYKQFHERGHTYPWFVLPLPRNEGFEIYLVHFTGDSIYMTSLLEYKLHNENAPIHLFVHHYTELATTHNLVLMQGENLTPNLSLQDAQYLMILLKDYYLRDDERFEKVRLFHQSPEKFNFRELIEDLKISIGKIS